MTTIPNLKLNSGYEMPIIGFGCAEFFNDKSIIEGLVYDAISLGYRHFDTAWAYHTDHYMGNAIRKAIADELIDQRSDVFVTTKIHRTHYAPEDLISQAKESNESLGLRYYDLIQLHGPKKLPKEAPDRWKEGSDKVVAIDDPKVFDETWKAMEQLVDMGITKSIGVANFRTKYLDEILKNATIIPANNQIHTTPLLHEDETINYCKEKGITVTAHSAFGGHPIPGDPNHKYSYSKDQDEWNSVLWQNEVLKQIAKKHNKSVAQILVKFHVARGVAVVVKTSKKERMVENMQVFDFDFDDNDWQSLKSLDQNRSLVVPMMRIMDGYDV